MLLLGHWLGLDSSGYSSGLANITASVPVDLNKVVKRRHRDVCGNTWAKPWKELLSGDMWCVGVMRCLLNGMFDLSSSTIAFAVRVFIGKF